MSLTPLDAATILDRLPFWIAVFNSHNEMTYSNAALTPLLGQNPHALGKSIFEYIGEKWQETIKQELVMLLVGKHRPGSVELRSVRMHYRDRPNEIVLMDVTLINMLDTPGIEGIVIVGAPTR